MEDNIGLNNKKVWPQTTVKKRGISLGGQEQLSKIEIIKKLAKPQKVMMSERHEKYLTRDPENATGHNILREKYSLPFPN